jgi:predicted AlkP superfamily pyrophosphatase or phosphodiesterase
MRSKLVALAALLCAAAAEFAAPPAATAAAPAPKQPKLIVVLVVDQFRYDYLTRFRSDYTRGFDRLLKQGAVYTNANYEQYPTVTAVGHATVLTGAPPAISGIVSNDFFDREANARRALVSDSNVTTLGNPHRSGSSPVRLLVSTVGDELKMSGRMPVKVIGVSWKDRSAILPAGRMADGAYWMDSETSGFVSSSWYFPQLPAWVDEFNTNHRVEQFAGKQWTPVTGGQPFATMPAAAGEKLATALDESPFGNELLLAFAEQAIVKENLGGNGGIDLLTLSFSCNDYVGHRVGPDDPRVRDMSIRTDRLIGQLFDFLEKRVGMANVLVALTADHGVAPLPEKMVERKMPGGRLTEKPVIDAIESALNARYGPGTWFATKYAPAPYFDHKFIESKGLNLAEVQQTAAQAVRQLPHIARVYTREELARGLAPADAIGRRVQNGFYYQRASDLTVIPEPYWMFDKAGTTHGTPYSYDSHVPLVLMGPGIVPGVHHRRVAVMDLAPTLATYLSVETPSGSQGEVLTDALAR